MTLLDEIYDLLLLRTSREMIGGTAAVDAAADYDDVRAERLRRLSSRLFLNLGRWHSIAFVDQLAGAARFRAV